jgi:hypothetical protein
MNNWEVSHANATMVTVFLQAHTNRKAKLAWEREVEAVVRLQIKPMNVSQ